MQSDVLDDKLHMIIGKDKAPSFDLETHQEIENASSPWTQMPKPKKGD